MIKLVDDNDLILNFKDLYDFNSKYLTSREYNRVSLWHIVQGSNMLREIFCEDNNFKVNEPVEIKFLNLNHILLLHSFYNSKIPFLNILSFHRREYEEAYVGDTRYIPLFYGFDDDLGNALNFIQYDEEISDTIMFFHSVLKRFDITRNFDEIPTFIDNIKFISKFEEIKMNQYTSESRNNLLANFIELMSKNKIVAKLLYSNLDNRGIVSLNPEKLRYSGAKNVTLTSRKGKLQPKIDLPQDIDTFMSMKCKKYDEIYKVKYTNGYIGKKRELYSEDREFADSFVESIFANEFHEITKNQFNSYHYPKIFQIDFVPIEIRIMEEIKK